MALVKPGPGEMDKMMCADRTLRARRILEKLGLGAPQLTVLYYVVSVKHRMLITIRSGGKLAGGRDTVLSGHERSKVLDSEKQHSGI